MYSIATKLNSPLPDISAFCDLINGLPQHELPAARTLFDPVRDLMVARAPGRLDLMGGIADYSGSLVLQLPIAEATLAAGQLADDQIVQVVSVGADETERSTHFQMDLRDFGRVGDPIEYAEGRAYFSQKDAGERWAAYVAGAFLVLMRERGATFERGVRLLIYSAVPEAKGVSSSAAVEVAAMGVIAALSGLEIDAREMAILCQKVENLVVGAPCGVMDQMASSCGLANQLLALRCQPAEVLDPVALPDELAVWGIDSGIRHAVSGADYGSVRVGAFMGYRILAELADVDAKWDGYLANVALSEFEQLYAAALPREMLGAEFLERYGGTTDSVTTVDPAMTYAVRQPTAHPIYEHFRVKTFARLLSSDSSSTGCMANAELLGELMFQSHASYSACGLGADGTDQLVALARQLGPENGIYGAKITGGGSGGTVAVLGRHDAEESMLSICAEYAKLSGYSPYVFSGSSPGAGAHGVVQLKNERV